MKSCYLIENYNRLYCSMMIEILIEREITHFYISPGMRNVPLISAILNHKEKLTVFSGIDERAQAFRALSYSKVTQNPSVLICTSGTAVANYLPAVIEAHKTQTPLIIISADRPLQLRNCGANQTINQEFILAPFIKDFLNIETSEKHHSLQAFHNNISIYFDQIKTTDKGLLHLNMAMNEPLDSTIEPLSNDHIRELENLKTYELPDFPLEKRNHSEDTKIIIDLLNDQNGLIVFGELPTLKNQEIIENFITKISSLGHHTYFDITSSLKFKTSLKEGMLPSFDHPEVSTLLSKKPPQFIIHFGGKVTSQNYYKFLKSFPNITLITINSYKELQDPARRQDIHIHQTSLEFITSLSISLQEMKQFNSSSFLHSPIIIGLTNTIQAKSKIIDNAPLTYPVISKIIMEGINDSKDLFLANSTAIRSFDNYTPLGARKNQKVSIYSNRGASGIEGTIASAIGVMDAIKRPLTLVIGDVSFLYDINSLHLLNESDIPLTIIICNNSGGGIFSLLPIAKDREVLPYITTPHSLEFENSAKQFNIPYQRVSSSESFFNIYNAQKALPADKKSSIIIEAIIDNEENIKIYQSLKTVKL